MARYKVVRGDSALLLSKIPNNYIDLTVTSPPYDSLRKYNNTCVWSDIVWKSVIDQLYRLTKQGGVVVWIVADKCIGGGESLTSFKQALYFQKIGFRCYDTMIWRKPSPQAPTEGRYYDVFEYMFIFSKGKPKTLNLIADRRNKSFGSVSVKETRSCREDRAYTGEKRVVKEFSRRFNVWDITRGSNKTTHPAVFPLKLARDHIITWSNSEDVVLDPFMGSGTTGVASVQLGRRFIGIDKVGSYCKIAKARIGGECQTK